MRNRQPFEYPPSEIGEWAGGLVDAIATAVIERLRAEPTLLQVAHRPGLSSAQAAKFLGVSTSTLTKMAENGKVPHLRVGTRRFYSEESLARMLAGEELELARHPNGVGMKADVEMARRLAEERRREIESNS